MKPIFFINLLLFFVCLQCSSNEPSSSTAKNEPVKSTIKIICMGGGITSGVNHATNLAYPAVLQQNLATNGISAKVVNAGIKGETSQQANERVDWLLQQRFDVFILAPAWEDFLKGHDLETVKKANRTLLEKINRTNPDALIVLLAPPLAASDQQWGDELKTIIEDKNGGYYFANPLNVPAKNENWQTNNNYPTVKGQQKIADYLSQMLLPLLVINPN